MDFELGGTKEIANGELVRSIGGGLILVRINDKEYQIKLLKSGSDYFEFILDDSFYTAKIIQSGSSEVRLSINGRTHTVKQHSKLTEILEKSLSLTAKIGGEKILVSQIPGRVVNVVAAVRAEVKKGDSIVVLESMKMQVAVKAHRDGIVKELRVKKGATVSRNDIIAVIE
ncbi:MAG: biotin/lipoyl-containing protein [Nitrososphaeraceae archaeon]|jgi:biotin carboxyl carrier protein